MSSALCLKIRNKQDFKGDTYDLFIKSVNIKWYFIVKKNEIIT